MTNWVTTVLVWHYRQVFSTSSRWRDCKMKNCLFLLVSSKKRNHVLMFCHGQTYTSEWDSSVSAYLLISQKIIIKACCDRLLPWQHQLTSRWQWQHCVYNLIVSRCLLCHNTTNNNTFTSLFHCICISFFLIYKYIYPGLCWDDHLWGEKCEKKKEFSLDFTCLSKGLCLLI